MIATVFLGPTMPVSEARDILPDAVFRPPAAQGDLLAAVDQDGADVVGLIDGTFHQNLSVWHNEVCYLLSQGITVFGASSMGALRAAETERFGAIGVGIIFRWYRDGIITGDDEVALLHGDEHSHYRQISVPLVNIRASLARAVTEGLLLGRFADQLIDIARALYYPERLVPIILQRCREAYFPPDQLQAAECALTNDYIDLKQADALEMLNTMRQMLDGSMPRPEPAPFEFTRSAVFETLYNLDRRVRVGNTEITLQAIAEHIALHCTDFNKIRRAALDRELVAYFGMLLGVRATDEEIVVQRTEFLEQRGLRSPQDLQAWLRRNSLNERDLLKYLNQEAVCARLRRWVLTVGSFDRGGHVLLNELRVRGDFPQWASAAAEEANIVTAYQDQPEYRSLIDEAPKRLAEKHAAHTNVRITGDARVWAEDAGFDGVEGLVEALRRSAIYNDVRGRISRQLRAIEMAEMALAEAVENSSG